MNTKKQTILLWTLRIMAAFILLQTLFFKFTGAAEGKLSINQRLQLWKHLSICSLCKTFSRQNKLITSFFSKHSEKLQHNIKPVDKEAIIKALKEADD